jgi:hypothetical protein
LSKVSVGQLDRSAVLPSPDRGCPKPRRDRLPDAICCVQRLPENAAIGTRLGGSIGRRHFGSQRLGSRSQVRITRSSSLR